MKFVKKRRVQKAEAAVERRAHAEHARQREIDFAKVTAERGRAAAAGAQPHTGVLNAGRLPLQAERETMPTSNSRNWSKNGSANNLDARFKKHA